MKKTAILSLYLFVAACAKNPHAIVSPSVADEGIVHGRVVKAKDEQISRSVVALVANREEGQGLCTGTLIADDTVLTAAHCVEGDSERITIIFGLRVKGVTPDHMREADAYVRHSRWTKASSSGASDTGRGDLAVVHFAGGVPPGYQAVDLVEKSFVPQMNSAVVLAGYGVTNGERGSGAGVLRQTKTIVVGDLSPTETITDGRKSSVCFGDSGGPAFVVNGTRLVQWGIASSVTNHACNEASIHTNVMPYRAWIRSASAKLRTNRE